MFSITLGELVTLGEAVIKTGPFGTQLKASEYVECGTPVLNVKNLGYGSVVSQKLDMVGPSTLERLDAHILRKGDIVFGRKGAVDRHAFISEAQDGWMQGSDCIRLRINSPRINPRFLSYYFLTSSHKAFMISMCSHGTTMASLNQKILERIEIPLPDVQIQNRIVTILGAVDDQIDNNNKINDNLLQQAQALYGKFFPYDVADELPAGWRVGTVGEIVEIHDSKRIPLSGAQRAKMEKRIYPYYGAASLMDYVDEYIFDGIYLLLGEDGTVVDDAGYPVLQYVWGQFWVNNHAHILTGKLGFNVESLLLLFKRTPVKSIVTGAVQPKISQANLRSVQVVIPPQPELNAFNELIRPMFDQIRQNQDQNKALAAMRDALLPKLMSGEVDVSAIQI